MRVGARGVTRSIAILREEGMTEKLYLRMRSCISGRQQNHKKLKKNQERIIRHCLKKMFLRVLMRTRLTPIVRQVPF